MEAAAEGRYRIRTPNVGEEDYIGFREIAQDLYQQVGENTYAIMHPDEILADNFALLVNGFLEDSTKTARLGHPGLLEDLKSTLQRID